MNLAGPEAASEGEGQRIANATLDGRPWDSAAIPATLTGEHEIVLRLRRKARKLERQASIEAPIHADRINFMKSRTSVAVLLVLTAAKLLAAPEATHQPWPMHHVCCDFLIANSLRAAERCVFPRNPSVLDVNLGYTYGAAHVHILPEYQRSNPVRPVILGETGYEAEPNAIHLLPDAKAGDLWTPFRIRRNAWWAVTSGAMGYCAGTRLWRWELNWRETMQVRSIQEAPNLLRGLQTIAWWRLAPDTEHKLVTAGFGQWKQADYVTAALADDGSCAIVYLPTPRTITVDLAKLKGPVMVQWFDPTTGESTVVEGAALQPRRQTRVCTPESELRRRERLGAFLGGHPMNRSEIHRTFLAGFTGLFALGLLALPEAVGGVRYPLKVSPNQRCLVDQDNQPVYIHGDTGWTLFCDIPLADAETYLENRRQKGFNTVNVQLVAAAWNQYDYSTRSPDGHLPFLKNLSGGAWEGRHGPRPQHAERRLFRLVRPGHRQSGGHGDATGDRSAVDRTGPLGLGQTHPDQFPGELPRVWAVSGKPLQGPGEHHLVPPGRQQSRRGQERATRRSPRVCEARASST